MSSMRTSLVLVDDHPLFRRGLREMFEASGAFEVVGEASGGREGIELARRVLPGMMLLDLHMAGLSGLQVLDEVRQLGLRTRVVVLTASLDRHELIEALRLGAAGYALKDTDPDALLAYVQRCVDGAIVLSEEMVALLAVEPAATADAHSDVVLTGREAQTLACISQGMNNKQIARTFGISDGTVKIYVKNLLRKLRLRSRLELAAWVHRTEGRVAPERQHDPAPLRW